MMGPWKGGDRCTLLFFFPIFFLFLAFSYPLPTFFPKVVNNNMMKNNAKQKKNF